MTRKQPQRTPYRRSDGRWVAPVVAREKGVQVIRDFYGTSKIDAQRKRGAFLLENPDAHSGQLALVPFGLYLERFAHDSSADHAESTKVQYAAYFKHINPAVGHVLLEELAALTLRRFMSTLADKKLSSSYRTHLYHFMGSCLKSAVHDGLIPRNPLDGVKRPKQVAVREMGAWEPEEVERLLKAIQGHPYEPLVTLCFTLGLRIGEAAALRWEDWRGDVLEVRHTLHRGSREQLLRPCKWDSARTLTIDPETEQVLERQRARLAELALEVGNPQNWNPHGLVILSRRGTPLDLHNVSRFFRAFTKKAGVKEYSTHAIRKTCTSCALTMLGVHEVQARLGHSDPRMTLKVYAKVQASRNRLSALPLSRLLRRGGQE